MIDDPSDPDRRRLMRLRAYAVGTTGGLAIISLLVFVFVRTRWLADVTGGLAGLTVGLLVLFALVQRRPLRRD